MLARPDSLDALIRDIAGRLRPVMPAMPQVEFDALVARMAEIEFRYARLDPQRPTPADGSPIQR